MKKAVAFILVLSICFCLCACGQASDAGSVDSSVPASEQVVSNKPSSQESTTGPSKQYVGDYEDEPVYQKLYEIESCSDPEQLLLLLNDLYGEEFNYIKIEWSDANNKYAGYKEPYDDFVCTANCMYNTYRSKAPVSSNTFLFFKEYSEAPSFIMDEDGTYLVSEYEIYNFDDGTHCHNIVAWICSDLYMCLHGYIDDDADSKDSLCEAVRYMDNYLDFENLIIDGLGDSAESTAKTESCILIRLRSRHVRHSPLVLSP